MKKVLLAAVAAATIAAGTLTAPTAADARCHGCGIGVGIAAGVIGGAIIGNAIVNAQPRGGYVVYDDFDAPYPRRCHDGYWARQRLYNRGGDFVGWSKPHFFCRD